MKLELQKHKGSGQWRKRIQGRDYYFGRYDEVPYRVALMHMYERQAAIRGGVQSQGGQSVSLTVRQLVDEYMLFRADDVQLGGLKEVTLEKYQHSANFVTETIGSIKVSKLRPMDFRRLQIAAAERFGTYKQRDLVTFFKQVITWGVEHDRIFPIKVPKSFKKPLSDAFRSPDGSSETSQEEKWVWTREQWGLGLRRASTSSEWMRPALYLGLNCGLGNTDVAGLKWSHIREVEGQMCMCKSRSKNGRPRMVPLWDETLAALGPRGEGRILETKTGLPLVSEDGRHDRMGVLIRRHVGRPFYGLRHMFMSIGSQVGDADGIRYMMGWASKDQADHYLLSTAWSIERLKKITEHVRRWSLTDSPQ